MGEAQHQVGLVGRHRDPEIAEMSRVAETKLESDYPADMLGKGTSAQLSLAVFDEAAVYMPNGHAQHPDMGTVDGK